MVLGEGNHNHSPKARQPGMCGFHLRPCVLNLKLPGQRSPASPSPHMHHTQGRMEAKSVCRRRARSQRTQKAGRGCTEPQHDCLWRRLDWAGWVPGHQAGGPSS